MLDNRHKPYKTPRPEAVPNVLSLNNSTPRSSTDDPTSQEPRRTVEVDFRKLKDGTLLEMIEDPHDPTKSLFATWNNGKVRYVENVECGNTVFVPIPRDAELIPNGTIIFARRFCPQRLAYRKTPRRSVCCVCRPSWIRKDDGIADSEFAMSQELNDCRY